MLKKVEQKKGAHSQAATREQAKRKFQRSSVVSNLSLPCCGKYHKGNLISLWSTLSVEVAP